MGFGGNISVGGGDTVWTGVIMIDPVNGSDGSGQRNVVSKPFATAAAAYAVYQEGDVMRFLPGTHTFTSTLLLTLNNEVHMDFFSDALIQGDIAGPLINSDTTALKLFIYGRGSFENTNNTIGANSAAIIASTKANILGAKYIHAVTGTLFGASNGFEVLENIDEMVADASYEINATSNDFTTVYQGIVRNCKKIGSLTTPRGLFLQIGTNDSIVFENCNFISSGAGNGYAAFIAGGTPSFKNCNFINESFRPIFSGASSSPSFDNCHFQQNTGSFEAFFVSGPGTKFNNCSFAHYGTGNAIRTNAPAEFSGINRFYADSNVQACAGTDNGVSIVSGTMIANVMNIAAAQASQTWLFQVITTPPTVGETYTITAPNGTDVVEYIVQAADTRDDVVNGLFAAWDTEVLADPEGYFADFNNKSVLLGPTV